MVIIYSRIVANSFPITRGTTITFDTIRPRENGHHLTDNIAELIFMDSCILNQISLKFVAWGKVNNKAHLLPLRRQTNNGQVFCDLYSSLRLQELLKFVPPFNLRI